MRFMNHDVAFQFVIYCEKSFGGENGNDIVEFVQTVKNFENKVNQQSNLVTFQFKINDRTLRKIEMYVLNAHSNSDALL